MLAQGVDDFAADHAERQQREVATPGDAVMLLVHERAPQRCADVQPVPEQALAEAHHRKTHKQECAAVAARADGGPHQPFGLVRLALHETVQVVLPAPEATGGVGSAIQDVLDLTPEQRSQAPDRLGILVERGDRHLRIGPFENGPAKRRRRLEQKQRALRPLLAVHVLGPAPATRRERDGDCLAISGLAQQAHRQGTYLRVGVSGQLQKRRDRVGQRQSLQSARPGEVLQPVGQTLDLGPLGGFLPGGLQHGARW